MTSTSSTVRRTNLVSLGPNTYVDGIYSLINPQVGMTRGGKPYLKCLVRDATGDVPARQWTFDENAIDELVSTGFVWVAGHSQVYNGQVQIILEQIKAVEVSDEDIAALLPTTKRDIDEMFAEVCRILSTLRDPAIRALIEAYLGDEDLMASFRQAPAAVSLHHAYIGGLLEHTLQLLNLADLMLPLYPKLNRDIVLTGLFLHDLGKTSELTWLRGFNYTTEGNLIGHVVRGAMWLQVKAAIAGRQSGHKLSIDTLRVLQHIIISHHGELEYGAAKLPSTPEAVFVSLLDNLDAKTSMAIAAARPDEQVPGEGEFTDKVWALGTRLYKPDPLRQ